jgi:hypothetical protein
MNDMQKIMVNGRVPLPHSSGPSVDVHRGMIIMTRAGEKAGFSAGVVVRQADEDAAFVLLGRLPVTSEYRLIPVTLINRIDGETIHLNADCDEILKLHLHQPV